MLLERFQTISKPKEWNFNRRTINEDGRDKAEALMERYFRSRERVHVGLARHRQKQQQRQGTTSEITSEQQDGDVSAETVTVSTISASRPHDKLGLAK